VIEVGVTARFEAGHRLRGDFGPATLPHRHAYRVDVTARGGRLRADGTLLDIGGLQAALASCVGELDGKDLDELDTFGGENTTAERVAEHVWRTLAAELRAASGVAELRVAVYESADAWAAVDRPLGSSTDDAA
jgi:6-pyruvoyltetrahydropterin/6-carboxytetrahydropterin synthase